MRIRHIELHGGASWSRIDLYINGDISAISDEVSKINEHPERYEVEFKRTDKRSLKANRYAWELIGKLAAVLRTDKNTIYREIVRDVPGISRTVLVSDEDVEAVKSEWESNGIGWMAEEYPSDEDGRTELVLYKGSSRFDPSEMQRFIELIQAECKDQRIETMTPQELERLKY